MSHLYVITVCNKYYESRFLPSKNTWLSGLSDDEDYILMGETPMPELKMAGFWEDNGQYLNLGWRKLKFLSEYRDYLTQFDYITFVDDDGYLFRNRLKNLIYNRYSPDEPFIIGHSLRANQVRVIKRTKLKYKILHGGATITCTNRMIKNGIHTIDKYPDEFLGKLLPRDIRRHTDVALSYLSGMCKAEMRAHNRQLSFRHHKEMRYKMSDYYKIISTHYASAEDKYFLHDIEKKEREREKIFGEMNEKEVAV